MPIHTLQTTPQAPEETPFSGLLQGLAICLLSLTLFRLLGPAGILVAAVILLLRRYLLREDLCEDWAETCCCEQSSYDATAIWCAEWYKALRDRESCVRTYAHAHHGTPAPCQG